VSAGDFLARLVALLEAGLEAEWARVRAGDAF
jgi:hypothetical protein